MDLLLLGTASAFGLAASAGLNTTLPLLLVGVLARLGFLTLSAPFDALSSDIALGGLVLLVIIEVVGDKVPGMDTVVQALQWPLAAVAGAVLFASQTSLISSVHPGLAIIVGLITAGSVHGARTAVRPAVTGATMGFGNWIVSGLEDFFALVLTAFSVFLPVVGFILVVILMIIVWLLGKKTLPHFARFFRSG